MKIAMAQLNPTVGDIDGNTDRIIKTMSDLANTETELIVFSELFLTGYPPRDFLNRPDFINNVHQAILKLQKISKNYPNLGILFGAPIPNEKQLGRGLYNSAILISNGKILCKENKFLLPTYDVFDEARYFDRSDNLHNPSFHNEILGISICEDAWNDPELWPKRYYSIDPIEMLARAGVTVFLNISASPFYAGKEEIRFRIIQSHAKKHGKPFIFVNQVGGNDELIFDGRSMFVDSLGNPVLIMSPFKEEIKIVDTADKGRLDGYSPQEKIESIHDALVLGLKDYLRKTGFTKALLGLSGGIDSAVTCALACEALGAENVMGITMPSPYSSGGSVEDSRQLAVNLDIEFRVIPIADVYATYIGTLSEHFKGKPPDIAEENIQARIRGNILMALSNKFGHIVLSTGNKSELAVGYCTLYGDMSGGLNVIADVPKTMVYQLAQYINRHREIIPKATIDKPPSAELRPNQVDQDTLPPYETLDAILHYYLEKAYSFEQIVALNYDPATIKWVVKAVHQSEYKRRQAALGLKVTSKAFGVGRRMPIAARYKI